MEYGIARSERLLGYFCTPFRRHFLGIQWEPNAPQIQAIRIKASINRNNPRTRLNRVEAARIIEPAKTFIIQFKTLFFTATLCKFRTARTMFTIIRIIQALRIMENRKQAHHINIGTRLFRQEEPIVFHLMPMLNAMNLGLIEPILKSKIH